jgi:hypothetical protein
VPHDSGPCAKSCRLACGSRCLSLSNR